MSADHFLVALFKSFGLHIFIGAALVVSVGISPPPKPTPKVIEVQPIKSVAVDQQKLTEQVNKIKSQKAAQKAAEEKRVRDLEARAKRAEQNRKSAESQIKDLNKKKRQSQQEKRAADAAAKKAREKQKREQAKAKKAADDAKKKLAEKAKAEKAAADAERKRKDAEKRAKQEEAARKAKAERERKERERKAREAAERAEQERMMQEQMAAEQAAREAAYRKQVLSEVDKFKALITQRIDQSIIKDQSMKGKSCKVNIRLAFNGLVTSVKILSGDSRVCQATEAGIYKAGKLPVSEDPTVFAELKNINITFIPEFD